MNSPGGLRVVSLPLGGYLHVCSGWLGHFREGRRLPVAMPFNGTAGDDKC
jgi:hypothetical protein